jgi:hypothetical protein
MATTEPKTEFLTLWQSLSPQQQKYAAARLAANSDADAARQAGVPISTARQWKNKADVDKAIRLMAIDAISSSVAVLTANLNRALMVLVEDLDSEDKRLRHDAATEITDRVLGKATVRVAPINPDGTAYQATAELTPQHLDRVAELMRLAQERRAAAQAKITTVDTVVSAVVLEDEEQPSEGSFRVIEVPSE